MSKIKKIISNSYDFKPKVVYNLSKLSQYSNIKDHISQKYKSNIVYKCINVQVLKLIVMNRT